VIEHGAIPTRWGAIPTRRTWSRWRRTGRIASQTVPHWGRAIEQRGLRHIEINDAARLPA